MIVRFVEFSVSLDASGRYDALVSNQLGPINRAFGCTNFLSLRKSGDPSRRAIISMWARQEHLDAMRKSDRYQRGLLELRQLASGELDDRLFCSDSDPEH